MMTTLRTTPEFIEQRRIRVPRRIQLFTDGYHDYSEAIEHFYGTNIDYAQLIKPMKATTTHVRGQLEIVIQMSDPFPHQIRTSYVEGRTRRSASRFAGSPA